VTLERALVDDPPGPGLTAGAHHPTGLQDLTRLLTDHPRREELSRAAVASVDRLRPDVITGLWSALVYRLAATAWDPALTRGAASG
jgi:hypothetical protein